MQELERKIEQREAIAKSLLKCAGVEVWRS